MHFITEPLTTGIVFYFVYMTLELFARRNERMRLIEKLGQSSMLPDASALKGSFNSLFPFSRKSFTALRMGCLLVGLGLGLFVGLWTCIHIRTSGISDNNWDLDSVAYGGSLLFFGGTGLIISHIIESRSMKKEEK
jgi:hypothetical protein